MELMYSKKFSTKLHQCTKSPTNANQPPKGTQPPQQLSPQRNSAPKATQPPKQFSTKCTNIAPKATQHQKQLIPKATQHLMQRSPQLIPPIHTNTLNLVFWGANSKSTKFSTKCNQCTNIGPKTIQPPKAFQYQMHQLSTQSNLAP